MGSAIFATSKFLIRRAWKFLSLSSLSMPSPSRVPTHSTAAFCDRRWRRHWRLLRLTCEGEQRRERTRSAKERVAERQRSAGESKGVERKCCVCACVCERVVSCSQVLHESGLHRRRSGNISVPHSRIMPDVFSTRWSGGARGTDFFFSSSSWCHTGHQSVLRSLFTFTQALCSK